MVDIRELARRSGVSAATVSRALNDRAEVSPQTRARILELAAELGYSPSQPARTLVRKRSDTIGLIWDTGYERDGRRHPFLQDLLVALKRPLSDAGYHLMLLATAESEAAVDTYLRATRQHSLDGVILMGVDERHPAITAVIEAAVPCVAVDLPLRGARATYVSSDNRTGAASAVTHLHALGRRRIAIINGPLSLMPASERLAGYRYQSARARPAVPAGVRRARRLLPAPAATRQRGNCWRSRNRPTRSSRPVTRWRSARCMRSSMPVCPSRPTSRWSGSTTSRPRRWYGPR